MCVPSGVSFLTSLSPSPVCTVAARAPSPVGLLHTRNVRDVLGAARFLTGALWKAATAQEVGEETPRCSCGTGCCVFPFTPDRVAAAPGSEGRARKSRGPPEFPVAAVQVHSVLKEGPAEGYCSRLRGGGWWNLLRWVGQEDCFLGSLQLTSGQR